jgi:hypothetical protein
LAQLERKLALDGTLVLAPGSHGAPNEGVCVVELASVLAGERFGDNPDCVCPVIGAYLRCLNDRASHAERQQLIPYAPRIVDSRGDRRLTRLRRDICLAWTGATPHAGGTRRAFARLAARIRFLLFLGIRPGFQLNRGAGEFAARLAYARHGSEAALSLLEELLDVGGQSRPAGTEAQVSNGVHSMGVSANGHRPGVSVSSNGRGTSNGRGSARSSEAAVNGGSPSTADGGEGSEAPPLPSPVSR